MTEFPELTPEEKADVQAYVVGWNDPDEARRRRIEALAHIVDGLFPWSCTPGLCDDDDNVYYNALRRAKRTLVWDLAWAGALDGAAVFDEGSRLRETISRLDGTGPDPMLLTVLPDRQHSGELLADFVGNLIEGYVGLPGTKMYGPDAIVELARDWLTRTERAAPARS